MGYVHDTQMSQFIPPSAMHFVTGTWTDAAGQVAEAAAMVVTGGGRARSGEDRPRESGCRGRGQTGAVIFSPRMMKRPGSSWFGHGCMSPAFW